MDWVDILALISMCAGYIIFVPLLMYYKYQKDKLKNKDMLAIRQSAMIDLQVGLSVTGILFERLFVCGLVVWRIPFLSNHQWLAPVFDGVFIWSVLFLFVIRIWLLFFSMKWNQSIAGQSWTTHINPEYKSFYIHYRDSWGNFFFLLKLLIVPFFVFIVAESAMEIAIGSPVMIQLLGLFSILFIAPSVMMYRRIDQAKDVFGIKREIGFQCLLLIAIFVVHLLLITLDLALPADYVRIEWLIRLFIGSVVLFAMSFISTYFPVHLYRKRHQVNRHGMTSTRMYLHAPATSHHEGDNFSQSVPAQSTEHGMFRMLSVLSEERGFKAFMTHLCSELSSENMLFIYEYIQIKSEFQRQCNGIIKIPKPKSSVQTSSKKFAHSLMRPSLSLTRERSDSMRMAQSRGDGDYVVVDFNVEKIDPEAGSTSFWQKVPPEATSRRCASYIFNVNGTIFARVLLPANLPKSILLAQRSRFIDRLYLLYLKYIARGCELEINISSIQRKRISQTFDGIMDYIEGETEHKEEAENVMNDNASPLSTNSTSGSKQESVDGEEGENALNFEVFTLLDKASIEILLLMRQSYERFAARSLPVLKQKSDGLDMIDYRTQAIKMGILKDGELYAALRKEYGP